MKVDKEGFDESERTWEPLVQVYENVPVITKKYVTEVNDNTLWTKSKSQGPVTTTQVTKKNLPSESILLVVFIAD